VALGKCEYILCDSMLGSSFRASFAMPGGNRADREVLLCSTHEQECRPIRDRMPPGSLALTPDGQVYSAVWLEALVG
jgi:hypothetical protein